MLSILFARIVVLIMMERRTELRIMVEVRLEKPPLRRSILLII